MLHLQWLPLLIGLAASQTFPGFVPEVSEPLVIEYALNDSTPEFVSPEGKLMDMTVVASPPTIGIPLSFNSTESQNGFLLIMVDTDVLLPNANNITTNLHYMRGNFTIPPATSPTPDNPSISLNFTELSFPTGQSPLAAYQSPAPSLNQKHRYTFLLFNQPSSFVDDCEVPDWKCIPAAFQGFLTSGVNGTVEGVMGRSGFNVSLFMEEAGLGAPVAGCFMEVENGNDSPIPTTNGTQMNVPDKGDSSASATASASAKATGSSTSQAGMLDIRLWLIWCALVLIACETML